ncbi:hypothetical protein B0H14DRAFT_2345176 [Mycena olivaceomarginata]|nr:hypothetical protein B0H14DRAFT_2345176 [Mycena olivaceomarginata]
MPRRSPPSSLRLWVGPVPARSIPKHTMPSMPRPTWAQPAALARGPSPRPQAGHKEDPVLAVKFSEIPSHLLPPTPSSQGSMRGPWDHSGSIQLPMDVESLLSPLKPAALV